MGSMMYKDNSYNFNQHQPHEPDPDAPHFNNPHPEQSRVPHFNNPNPPQSPRSAAEMKRSKTQFSHS